MRLVMPRWSGGCPFKTRRDRTAIAAIFVMIAGIVAPPIRPAAHAASIVEGKFQFAAFPPAIFGPSATQPEPLHLPDTALEPVEWNALKGWSADDHAAAFATFLASCRPLLRSSLNAGEKRPMYPALIEVCRRAFGTGRLTDDQARLFLERNFRPVRITKLGDNAGLLTGYYEPIVDGSRFPTGIFKVPIYRRPPDLVPPPVRISQVGEGRMGVSVARSPRHELTVRPPQQFLQSGRTQLRSRSDRDRF